MHAQCVLFSFLWLTAVCLAQADRGQGRPRASVTPLQYLEEFERQYNRVRASRKYPGSRRNQASTAEAAESRPRSPWMRHGLAVTDVGLAEMEAQSSLLHRNDPERVRHQNDSNELKRRTEEPREESKDMVAPSESADEPYAPSFMREKPSALVTSNTSEIAMPTLEETFTPAQAQAVRLFIKKSLIQVAETIGGAASTTIPKTSRRYRQANVKGRIPEVAELDVSSP